MKTLYIECNMGVAGDMLMGALYELCDQKEKFLSDMNQAFAPYGVTLSVEPVSYYRRRYYLTTPFTAAIYPKK